MSADKETLVGNESTIMDGETLQGPSSSQSYPSKHTNSEIEEPDAINLQDYLHGFSDYEDSSNPAPSAQYPQPTNSPDSNTPINDAGPSSGIPELTTQDSHDQIDSPIERAGLAQVPQSSFKFH